VKVFVLPEAEARASDKPEHRRSLDRFIEVVSRAETMGELVAFPQIQRVVNPMFKWKMKRTASRIIFRVSSSPKQSVLHIFVHTCMFSGGREYAELETSGRFSPDRISAAESDAGAVAFVESLDREDRRPPAIPRDYIGIRRLPAVLEPLNDGLVVEESEGWVERILANCAAVDGSFDRETVEIRAGVVFDAIVADGDSIVGMTDEVVLVEKSDGVTRVSLDREESPRVRRRLSVPAGRQTRTFLAEAASASSGQVDPFLLWHPRQEEFLRTLSTNPRSLPAFVDGPGGSGKTAILMWLVRGVLQHLDDYHTGTSVRFVTVSHVLATRFAEGLLNHLVLVDGLERTEATRISADVCRTVDNYLLEFVEPEERLRFLGRNSKVEWRHFHRWFVNLHPSQRPKISPHEAWCAMRALVRGDVLQRDDPRYEMSREEYDLHLLRWFGSLKSERRQGLDERHIVATLGILPLYLDWKAGGNRWDDADLVEAAVEGHAAGLSAGGADLLVVDEAQDLTPDTVRFLVRSGGASRFRLDLEYQDDKSPVPLPIVFAADDLQTINPSGFEWDLFRAVFYEETALILNRTHGVTVDPAGLEINFRMRANVHGVAHGLRRWMRPSIPAVPPDHVRDGGYSGPCNPDHPGLPDALGSVSRIIVPVDPDMYAPGSPVRRLLDSHGVDWQRVLPVTATKGDEFGSVALVGFAEFLRHANPGQQMKYARQLTYVAASRAKDVAVWIEPDSDDVNWFWRGDDGNSPSPFLPPVEPFTPECLEPFRMTSDQMIRDELVRLVSLMRNTSDEGSIRSARARAAAANIRMSGNPESETFARSADELARYFEGDTASFRIGSLAAELQRAAIEMAAIDGEWTSFAGPHDGPASPDLLAGWAVDTLARNDIGSFFAVAEIVDDAGLRSLDELHPSVREALGPLDSTVIHSLRTAAEEGHDDFLSSVSPVSSRGTAILTADPLFPSKLSFFLRWSRRQYGGALLSLRELASEGDSETAYDLSRRLVVSVCGVPWVSPDRAPAVAVQSDMNESELVLSLEHSCLLLCSEENVMARFLADVRRGGHGYDDTQMARFARVAFEGMAAELTENTPDFGKKQKRGKR
jgi:hypothetical protein